MKRITALAISTFALGVLITPAYGEKPRVDDWESPGKRVEVKDPKSVTLDDRSNYYVFSQSDLDRGVTINGKPVRPGVDKVLLNGPGAGSDTAGKASGGGLGDGEAERNRCDLNSNKCVPGGTGAFCHTDSECEGRWNYRCAVDSNTCALGGRGRGCASYSDCTAADLRCDSMTNTCRAGGDGPPCAPGVEYGDFCTPEGKDQKYCDLGYSGNVCTARQDHDTWITCSEDMDCANIKVCTSDGKCAGHGDNSSSAPCSSDHECSGENRFCLHNSCWRGFGSPWAARCTRDGDCKRKACNGDYCYAGANGRDCDYCTESWCDRGKCHTFNRAGKKECDTDSDCAQPSPVPSPQPE